MLLPDKIVCIKSYNTIEFIKDDKVTDYEEVFNKSLTIDNYVFNRVNHSNDTSNNIITHGFVKLKYIVYSFHFYSYNTK